MKIKIKDLKNDRKKVVGFSKWHDEMQALILPSIPRSGKDMRLK